ncbi:hypothetical protein B4113_2452 [Geobacillus sp. B4113_201601]|nr:hypothetical protein B4113_2452 [Geobacillus sp. B4113_201601]
MLSAIEHIFNYIDEHTRCQQLFKKIAVQFEKGKAAFP